MTMKSKSKFQLTTMFIENAIICFIIGSIFPLQTKCAPIKIVQVVGSTVSLNCSKSSSDDIIWRFNEDLLYDGTEFRLPQFKSRSRFENDSVTGKEYLKISGIKPGDAGLYRCLTASPETLLQSTQLTVLDSQPSCESNIPDDGFVGPNTCQPVLKQDYMKFSCAVKYYGTKFFRLQWEDVMNNQIQNDSECDESKPDMINCNLTLKAEPQYDGSVFRCKVLTLHDEQYSCNTNVAKVHYFTLKNDSKSDENLVKSNQENRTICQLQEDKKIDPWHTIGLNYICTVYYSIKNTKCSAVVSVKHPSNRELSWILKSLSIVNSLVLFVYAVVSYFFLVNAEVKRTFLYTKFCCCENMNKKSIAWSKILLSVFAVLDFGGLMLILANPNEKLFCMKYIHAVSLLFLTLVEALFLLILRCGYEVCSGFVKFTVFILWLLAVVDVVSAAIIFAGYSGKASDGETDDWVNGLLITLVVFVCLGLAAFVMANCCRRRSWCNWRSCKRINEWAASKRNILSALKSHGAINDSDYKKILVKNDEDEGISLLLDEIQGGSEEDCSIFKMVIKKISGIDIDHVEKKDFKTDNLELVELLSGEKMGGSKAEA